MKKMLLLVLLSVLLSGCMAYYQPSNGYGNMGVSLGGPPYGVYDDGYHYQTHAPFYDHPPIPPPCYRPDPYGHWIWRHRVWDWQPGI